MTSALIEIALAQVLNAADVLSRAARWDDATRLLDAARPTSPADRLAVAIAQATAAVDQDFAQQTNHAPAALAHLSEALSITSDPVATWDHAFLRLRKDYATTLFSSSVDENSAGVSASMDEDSPGALAQRAKELSATAPTDDRAGHATFYAGVIDDNLLAAPTDAFSNYTVSLDLAHKSGDRFLESLALRHLGDHAHTAGDLTLARAHWERSTELRQQTGHLFGTLAQQALLATLATDEANPQAAKAIATEVHRWSTQLGTAGLTHQAAHLLT